MSDLLFAYGTLLPGEVRWHFLQPFVTDEGRADAVVGSLRDTGFGYPAAVFAAPGSIRGRVFVLRPERAREALEVLDEVERTADDHYRRVRVQTVSGAMVWAYEYTGPDSYTPIEGGSWTDHVASADRTS